MLSGKRVVAIKKAQQTFLALRKIDCNSCYKCNRCPQHVAIPRNFDAINKLYIHSDPEVAKDYYRGSVALIGGEATACIDCKWCESVCPQHIEISSWMKKLPQLLSLGFIIFLI